MASGIVAHGLQEAIRDLKEIDKALGRAANKALRAAGKPVLTDARVRAPRRSGALARSLRIATPRSKVVIRSALPYAPIVHWGGRHPLFGNREKWYPQPSRPFIADAAEAKGDEALRILGDEIDGLFSRHGFK